MKTKTTEVTIKQKKVRLVSPKKYITKKLLCSKCGFIDDIEIEADEVKSRFYCVNWPIGLSKPCGGTMEEIK